LHTPDEVTAAEDLDAVASNGSADDDKLTSRGIVFRWCRRCRPPRPRSMRRDGLKRGLVHRRRQGIARAAVL